MKRQLYGEMHPRERPWASTTWPTCWSPWQRYDDAEAAYRPSLAINRKLLGESHRTIANNLTQHRLRRVRQGRDKSAIETMRESLDMSRKELGPEHPELGARASSLAYWLVEEGEFDEAERLVDEALNIRRKALGAEHPQVGGALTDQGQSVAGREALRGCARNWRPRRDKHTADSLPPGSWQSRRR